MKFFKGGCLILIMVLEFLAQPWKSIVVVAVIFVIYFVICLVSSLVNYLRII